MNIEYFNSIDAEYPWQGKLIPILSMQFVATLRSGVELRPQDDVTALERHNFHKNDGSEMEFPLMKRVISDVRCRYVR